MHLNSFPGAQSSQMWPITVSTFEILFHIFSVNKSTFEESNKSRNYYVHDSALTSESIIKCFRWHRILYGSGSYLKSYLS